MRPAQLDRGQTVSKTGCPSFCTVGDSHQGRDSCESPAFPPGERKYTLLGESGIVVRLREVGYPDKYGHLTATS
jgi:hypothetical protein